MDPTIAAAAPINIEAFLAGSCQCPGRHAVTGTCAGTFGVLVPLAGTVQPLCTACAVALGVR